MPVTTADLLTHLRDELGVEVYGIDDQTPLFSSGIVDSFALIALIGHLEDRTGIRVEAPEITLQNFDTLSRMLAFIERRSADAPDAER